MRTRLGFVVIAAALLFPSHLDAADAPKNALSFSFSNSDPSISYRRSFGMFAGLISGSYAHFSYDTSQTDGPSASNSGHDWTLGVGLRRYLAAKTAVQPFVQFDIGRSVPTTSAVIGGTCGTSHADTASLTGGAEYHFTPSISIEGRAGLAGSKFSTRCSSPEFSFHDDSRTISTFRSAVSLNFYF
jgi:hypothetical protein